MKKILTPSLTFLLSLAVFSAEKPYLKIAVTTDIHAQWETLERVYGFLAEKNPDVVLFAGDLARYIGDEKSYKNYIAIYNKHFSKCTPAPVHIPIPGNHDYWEYKGVKRLSPEGSLKRFFHPMGMEANWLQHHVVKGCTFIGISATDEKGENFHTPEEIQKVSDLITQAEKNAPGKPVFVMTHCPPAFTMAASPWYKNLKKVWDWRYDLVYKMLAGHKQVVSISGHTHLPLHDERTIWQGEFTAFNAGGLYEGSFQTPGPISDQYIPFKGVGGQSFCYIEVYSNRMVIYRYSARTLKEISPEKRWQVALPYDPQKAVYTAQRAEKTVQPEFPTDAKAEFIKKDNRYYLRLDRAVHSDFVYAYRVKLTFDDKLLKPQEFYIISDFFEPDQPERSLLPLQKNVTVVPHASGFIELVPVETFGKEGKSITVRFQFP